jgi:hypothetical protein
MLISQDLLAGNELSYTALGGQPHKMWLPTATTVETALRGAPEHAAVVLKKCNHEPPMKIFP